tara:strand:+ start:197 stop:643 length:447 start_codon:yes stop_codon:yes gene_type:complete
MPQTTTTVLNTENQLYINRTRVEIFIGNNSYKDGEITNGTGAELVIPAGTIIGRVSADNKFAILVSTASDGSQFPIGVVAEPLTLAIGASGNLTICNGGLIKSNHLIFSGAETLETVISDRTLGDRLASDNLGIKLIQSREMTSHDNS